MPVAKRFNIHIQNQDVLMDVGYFQRLLTDRIVHTVKEMSWQSSGAKFYQVHVSDGVLLARKSLGYYGKEGFLTEMRITKHLNEINVTPKLYYFFVDDMVSVSEYVDDVGILTFLETNQKNIAELIVELARSFHKTNALKIAKPCNMLEEMKKEINKISFSLFDDEILDIFEYVKGASWKNDVLTLSHNDFHPQNILYDGERLRLIDWEMAGLAHPFYDIAFMSNYLFYDRYDAYEFLSLYTGKNLTTVDKTTFDNFRRIAYGLLASMNFQACAQKNQSYKLLIDPPVKRTYRNVRDLWSRAIKENDGALHYQLGLMFIRECSKY